MRSNAFPMFMALKKRPGQSWRDGWNEAGKRLSKRYSLSERRNCNEDSMDDISYNLYGVFEF